MNEKRAPQHLRDYVQEMVEVGVQLSRMLEHMYRFQATNADSSGEPPPEILRDLVASTLQRSFRASKRDVERATNLLRLASTTISEELMLVEPGAFDDLGPEDFDDYDPPAFDDRLPDDPFMPPGETRLH